MSDERRRRGRSENEAVERTVPTAAESWRRNVEILELVNRIRATRRTRATSPSPAPRVSRER